MATINDIGIPGIGTGILHPKLKNRWRITFANMGAGADSQPLSMQAITVVISSFITGLILKSTLIRQGIMIAGEIFCFWPRPAGRSKIWPTV